MMKEERAKQFLPFDAMKGLKEALLDREERHSRVERHEISEEQIEHNSEVLLQVEKGTSVSMHCFRSFHNILFTGTVTEIDLVYKYLQFDTEKIPFADIYDIRILDKPNEMRFKKHERV